MAWFTNWFEALTVLQQVFACVALPATGILLIQTVLLILGMGFGSGEGDAIGDTDADVDTDTDLSPSEIDGETDSFDHGAEDAAGLRLFTLRGLVAMFAIGGWMGIASVDLGASEPWAIVIAALSGIAALVLVAYILRLFLKLQESGNLDARNAIARTAKVYLTIPAARTGTGKVMLTLQERLVEMEAVTDFEQEIKTDCMVQVVSVADNVLVVRPLNRRT